MPIARTGEMIYGDGETPLESDDKGVVRIMRDEEEVFRPETMASFEGKAFTISHPEQFVDPNNWADLAKGILQNVRRGEGDQSDDLLADILVTDAVAIGLVKRGLREVSCGYEAEYIQTGDGQGRQTNIIGNHLALVEQGRAGPAYAINDHKGRTMKQTFGEKFKAYFGKAVDEAVKEMDADMEEKKEDKAKDDGQMAMDELVKMVKDLGEKIGAMAQPKDAAPEMAEKKEDKADDAEEPKEEKKADDAEMSGSIEDRLKALEMAVSKIMEGESMDGEYEDSGEEMVGDEDKEDEESKDAAGCATTGDTAARAEILAPGIEQTKDLKAKALKIAYGTKEGKKIIDSLTGGKAPVYDSAEKVDVLFIAASEVLKATRSSALSKTKQTRDFDSFVDSPTAMTPERMNEINAAKYNAK